MTETLQILEKLNALYSGAFSQLVTYTVGVLAFIGILIPLAIASFQNRQLKRDQVSLTSHISNELSAAKLELKREIEDQIAKREEKLQQLIATTRAEIAEEVRKIDRLAVARSLHLQAAASLQDMPGYAAFDGLSAAEDYAQCENEGNLISVLRLIEQALPKTIAADFETHNIQKACDGAIKAIERLNGSGRYSQEITSLKRAVYEASKRADTSNNERK